jgi:hypothetical protein
MSTFLAKISPNPSITPLTNGSSRLTANAEKKADTRARVESDGLKIASVTVMGAAVSEGYCERSGEGRLDVSGKVMEGKDEVEEAPTSSHFCDREDLPASPDDSLA